MHSYERPHLEATECGSNEDNWFQSKNEKQCMHSSYTIQKWSMMGYYFVYTTIVLA